MTISPDPGEGPKWTGPVTFAMRIPTDPTMQITDPIALEFAKTAAAMWSAMSGVNIVWNTPGTASDVMLEWDNLNTPTTGFIGLTSYSYVGTQFSPNVNVAVEAPSIIPTVAEGNDLRYGPYASYLYQDFAHEEGHALGEGHNPGDANALMNPYLSPTNRSADQSDLEGIQAIYGPPPNPSLLIPTMTSTNAFTTTDTAGPINALSAVSVRDAPGMYETVVIKSTGGTVVDPTPYGTYIANGDNTLMTEEAINLVDGENASEQILHHVVFTPTVGTPIDGTLTVTISNTLGYSESETETIRAAPLTLPPVVIPPVVIPPIVTPPVTPIIFNVLDTSTNTPMNSPGETYSGPVIGVTNDYINITTDSLNISATTPNVFIHSGSGTDAIQVMGGTNVLDGGTGSNFLTGASGMDNFFVDDRGPTADIWSTLNNFGAGDTATVWGVSPGDFNIAIADNLGTAGYTGLTLTATQQGHASAALTIAGASMSDVTVSYGHDTASNSNFMYVQHV